MITSHLLNKATQQNNSSVCREIIVVQMSRFWRMAVVVVVVVDWESCFGSVVAVVGGWESCFGSVVVGGLECCFGSVVVVVVVVQLVAKSQSALCAVPEYTTGTGRRKYGKSVTSQPDNTRTFFVRKQISQLFCNFRLALLLFDKRILAKNALVKCWWNWPQVWRDLSTGNY